MSPTRWKAVYFFTLLVSGVFLVLAMLSERESAILAFAGLGLGILLLSSLTGLWFWRCPWCKKLLPPQGLVSMDFCPHCSNILDHTSAK